MNVQNDNQWKVCVRCFTYNQASYIKDAMNGFTMQQTDFPYVCCIVDDASTDGEQDVIKQYLQDFFDLDYKTIVRNEKTEAYSLTFSRHKTNLNCYFAVLFLRQNHYRLKKSKLPYISEWNDHAEYIAYCEGDDYWTQPTKLQQQADYLNTHPHVVLSCHRYFIYDVKSQESTLAPNSYLDKRKNDYLEHYEFDYRYAFMAGWFTKTLTLMVRKDAIDTSYHKHYKYARDVHNIYYIMQRGLGVCHSFNGGVYRKNVSTSIFGNMTLEEQKDINCRVYEELAVVTQDPVMKRIAEIHVVNDCMRRLKTYHSGYYYYVLRFLRLPFRIINLAKKGFRKTVPLIS